MNWVGSFFLRHPRWLGIGLVFTCCGGLVHTVEAEAQTLILEQAVADPGTGTKDDTALGLGLTGDRRVLQQLDKAKLAFEQRKYAEGLLLLQRLIEEDQDLPLEEEERTRFGLLQKLSLKSIAEARIGALPPEALLWYERGYGSLAQQMLEEAIEQTDESLLAEISQRFFHTQAGYQATYRLGAFHFDHGRLLWALRHWLRLQQSPGAKAFEPLLSIQVAACYSELGLLDRAEAIWKRLTSEHAGGTITSAGLKHRLPQSLAEWKQFSATLLAGYPQRRPLVTDWNMPRGHQTRNAKIEPVSPVRDTPWVFATTGDATTGRPATANICDNLLMKRDIVSQRSIMRPLPAASPLLIGNLAVIRSVNRVQAIDVQTGELAWSSIQEDPIFKEFVLQAESEGEGRSAFGRSPLELYFTQRFWHDRVAGSLSSDGQRVFAIEDLGVVGPDMLRRTRIRGQQQVAQTPYNRLAAYELKTGRTLWEVGGPGGGAELALSDTYLLGPPLPYNGSLYCLAENGGEIQLCVLDALTGKLQWQQTLLVPEVSLHYMPIRRVAGLSPSLYGGILVCPTGSGTVLAVDIEQQRLLWGYRYVPRVDHDMRSRAGLLALRMLPSQGFDLDPGELEGAESQPIIVGSSILLAPYDADNLYCIDLLSGSLRWQHPRGQMLYIAAVHNNQVICVERSRISALDLANGKPAWTDPIPISLPSGRGVLNGQFYHLPLASGEIATVDLEQRRMKARSVLRDSRIAGNLIAANGILMSQSEDQLFAFEAYPRLQQEIEQRLADNAADADALALRGEMRLHSGQELEGLEDLRRSIAVKPETRTRNLVVVALLEGLRTDFARYQDAVDEIERLVDDPQQRTTFLRLYAAGLQESNQREKAFETYLKLIDPRPSELGLEMISQALSVRSDHWIHSRIKTLYESASAEEKQAMDAAIQKRLDKAIDAKATRDLRQLLWYFDGRPYAERARMRLSEQLTSRDQGIELEQHLNILRRSDDGAIAAQATANLAALYIEQSRPQDAIGLLDELQSKYGDVVCMNHRTGNELIEIWKGRPEVARALAVESPWPAGRVESTRIQRTSVFQRSYSIPILHCSGPYFENWRLEIDQQKRILTAFDQHGGIRWRFDVQAEEYHIDIPHNFGNYAVIHGHLMLIVFGHHCVMFDALRQSGPPRVLWRYDSFERYDNDLGPRPQVRTLNLPGEGKRYMLADSAGLPLIELGPVTERFVCVHSGRKLVALDVVTGEKLWERRDLETGSRIFGNDDVVIAASVDKPRATVFHAADGVEIKQRILPDSGQNLILHDQSAITLISDEKKLYVVNTDVVQGEVSWSIDVPQPAKITLIEDEEMFVLGGDAVLRRIDLSDGSETLRCQLAPESELQDVWVFRRPGQYTVVVSRGPNEANRELQVNGIGNNNGIINGTVYGIESETGRKVWSTDVTNQALNLDQLNQLPVMVFACRIFYANPKPDNRNRIEFATQVLDQRTGEIVFEEKWKETAFAINIIPDIVNSRVELQSYQTSVELKFAKE